MSRVDLKICESIMLHLLSVGVIDFIELDDTNRDEHHNHDAAHNGADASKDGRELSFLVKV